MSEQLDFSLVLVLVLVAAARGLRALDGLLAGAAARTRRGGARGRGRRRAAACP